MKYYAFTANPAGYIEGWAKTLLLISNKGHASEDWKFIQEVEFDEDAVDTNEIRASAVQSLDNEMEQKRADFTAGMEGLQARKESLLAIEHKP